MTDTLAMDRRVVWDPKSLKQIDEAKAMIREHRSQGYEVQKSDGSLLEKFIPSLGEAIIKAQKLTGQVLRILSDSGDDRIIWDKENGKQAKEAKQKFEELVGKGYLAFSVDTKGNKNRRIEEFDVDAQEILMIPPTAKG